MGLREYFDDYYFGFSRRRRLKLALVTTAVGVVALIAILVVAATRNDDPRTATGGEFPSTLSVDDTVSLTSESAAIAPSSSEQPVAIPSSDGDVSSSVSGSTSTQTSQPARSTTTSAAEDTPGTASTPSSATTSVVASEAPGPGAPVENGPPATLPNGEPVPVVAVFDTDTITLTGAVPSQAAVDRLTVLALANSKTPAFVVNNLVINPNVAIGVGVRVIEMNSVRFPSGSAVVLPEHGEELQRVATVMTALPNVTVLVIGHADQLGNPESNFAISDARARAVVNYLVYVGISADRLSSRAVGETDLLLIDNDAASLALNRRTEFIFYGLLIG